MKKTSIENISKVLKTGKTPPSKNDAYFIHDYNWYTPGDIQFNKYLTFSERGISQKALDDKKSFLYPENSLLITCIGNIGRVGISKERSASNQQITAIKPNEELDVEFLYYWFIKNQEVISYFANNAVVPILNNQTLKRIEISYPPLKTQQEIVEILDAAAALRDHTKKLLEEYDLLAQSIFLDMFGDPVLNEKGWEVIPFGKSGKLDRGKSKHRPRNAPELLGGEYPLVQTGDVANSNGYITEFRSTYSELGLAQSKLWPKGTLCITIAANIAKTGILTFDACFPDSVVGFVPNELTNNEYTQHWMSFLQQMIEANAPVSAQKNINLKILRELEFMCPPISLQNEFAEKIEIIEQQKELAKQELKESEDLFQGLLQRAFKGELV